jgi:tetratricopeptide (TPR) repeat protein
MKQMAPAGNSPVPGASVAAPADPARAPFRARSLDAPAVLDLDMTPPWLNHPRGVRVPLPRAPSDPSHQPMSEPLHRAPIDVPEYELGVLFVHGIGESARADTLYEWGHALAHTMRDWLSGTHVVRLRQTVTVAPSDDPDQPPHAELEIGSVLGARFPGSPNESRSTSRWLLAESWWGGILRPPSYAGLAAWAFRAVPLTLVSHFDRKFRRAAFDVQASPVLLQQAAGLLKLVYGGMQMLAGLLLVPFVLLLVLLALILGLLPGPTRRAAAWIQRLLASYVGDSMVFVGNDVVAAEIFTRVRTDLEWLVPRCQRIAIVAHSQGGAVAHEVLRRFPRLPADVFVSVGSGLRKLSEIRRAEHNENQWLLLASALGALVASVGLVGAAAIHFPPFSGWVEVPDAEFRWFAVTAVLGGLIAGVMLTVSALIAPRIVTRWASIGSGKARWLVFGVDVCVGAVILALAWRVPRLLGNGDLYAFFHFLLAGGTVLSWISAGAWRHSAGRSIARSEQLKLDEVAFRSYFQLGQPPEWYDVFAPKDPVPNGALLDDLLPGSMNTRQVRNLDSVVGDHTTYWKNRDGFVWRLAHVLVRLCDLDPFTLDGTGGRGEARRGRVSRRREWRVLNLTLLRRAIVGTVALLAWQWWRGAPPGLAAVLQDANARIAADPRVSAWLPAYTPTAVASPAGVILLAAGAGLAYAVVRLVWNLWNGIEAARGIAGEREGRSAVGGPACLSLWLAIVSVALWAGGVPVESPAAEAAVVRASVFAALPAGPLAYPLAAAVTLLVVYLAYWLLRGLGESDPVRFFRLLRAVEPDADGDAGDWAYDARLRREAAAGDANAHFQFGLKAESEKRFADAERHWGLAHERGHPFAAMYLGWRWQRSGQPVERIEALYREQIARGHVAEYAYWLGNLLMALGRSEEAAEVYRQGGDAAGEASGPAGARRGDTRCLVELASYHERKGDGGRQLARKYLHEAVAAGRSDPLVHLADLEVRDGRPEVAIELYQEALDRGVRRAVVPLGRLLTALGERDAAVRVYAEGVRYGQPDAAMSLGELLLEPPARAVPPPPAPEGAADPGPVAIGRAATKCFERALADARWQLYKARTEPALEHAREDIHRLADRLALHGHVRLREAALDLVSAPGASPEPQPGSA